MKTLLAHGLMHSDDLLSLLDHSLVALRERPSLLCAHSAID